MILFTSTYYAFRTFEFSKFEELGRLHFSLRVYSGPFQVLRLRQMFLTLTPPSVSLSEHILEKLQVIPNVVSYHVAPERETKVAENVFISNTEISAEPPNRVFGTFWTIVTQTEWYLFSAWPCPSIAMQFCPRMRLHASDFCDYCNLLSRILLKPPLYYPAEAKPADLVNWSLDANLRRSEQHCQLWTNLACQPQ